jgi:hypothetical protein
MSNKQLEKAVFDACLKSALAMGDRIKNLSWFGKNHQKATSLGNEKLAA